MFLWFSLVVLIILRLILSLRPWGGWTVRLHSHVDLFGLGPHIFLSYKLDRVLKNGGSLPLKLLGGRQAIFLLLCILFSLTLISHDVGDLLLGSLKELFSLQSCLELLDGWTFLSSSLLRYLSFILPTRSRSCGSRIEKHSHRCKAHENILDILIVLMLSYNLLS